MTLAASDRSLVTEARIRTWVSPCGICDGQSYTGTEFTPSSLSFPPSVSFHRSCPHSYIIWGMESRPIKWLQFRNGLIALT
jgi:hypothetical protein